MKILQQKIDPKMQQVLDTLDELLNDKTFLENFRERILKD